MSARHKLPTNLVRGAPRETEAREKPEPAAAEAHQEHEFYAAWESREYGEYVDTPVRGSDVLAPRSGESAIRLGNTSRRGRLVAKFSQLPGACRRTLPYGPGSIEEYPWQPSASAPSSSPEKRAAAATPPAPDSGLFVRQAPTLHLGDTSPSKERATHRWHPDESGQDLRESVPNERRLNAEQRATRESALSNGHAPNLHALARERGVPREHAATAHQHASARESDTYDLGRASDASDVASSEDGLEARLREALRSLAESEANCMQAELRARSVERRLVQSKLAIARPTMRLQDSVDAPARPWPSQRMLWIGIACSALCLCAAAAYSTIYVPLQRRLVTQQALHERSQEEHQRELAALHNLMEQEQTRAALERNRLSARIVDLLARRVAIAPQADRDTTTSDPLQPALDSVPSYTANRKRTRRQPHSTHPARATSLSDQANPHSDSPSTRGADRSDDSIGDLQLR